MSHEKAVTDNYHHGNLLQAIEDALARLGKTVDTVTIDDLAPVDEFHIGGRLATENLVNQLGVSAESHVLDVGCGLGGASRFVASHHGSRVTGIDLTPEYIETGKVICHWLKLERRVTLQQGSALAMPFADESFDGAYMLHVAMNIEDKARLFTEVARVLKPGSRFGIYDVMRNQPGDLTYPVPWATEGSSSKLATCDQYRQALTAAGFQASEPCDRSEFALAFFKRLQARVEAGRERPALGLHTLMRESTPARVRNMIDNIAKGYIAPVELMGWKD
jgi:ubiquinone/menaquinone biosynthesis C-methylase UbiE